MAETKEYVSRSEDLGNIHISGDVLAVIAAAAAMEVEGVSSLAANLGTDLAELLGKKNLTKGVHIQVNEDSIIVDVTVMIKYGCTIQDVAVKVQDAVKNSVESMSGLTVEAVNVNVGGVTLEKETRRPQ